MTPLVIEPPVETASLAPSTGMATPVNPLAFLELTESDCEERHAQPQPEDWGTRLIRQAYLNSLKHCLGNLGWVPQSILEVGCGDGKLLTYVGQIFQNARIVGIEFSAEKIAAAKETNCCKIQFMRVSEAESLPFADGSFDLVISHGFLGESAIPRYWLKEMARVSAEALIVSAATPRAYQWGSRIPGLQRTQLGGKPVFGANVQPVSSNLMQAWVERAGLAVESVTRPMPFGMVLGRKPQLEGRAS